MKEAILHVDLDAILYNYRHLKCYYKKNVIAVLKDDAYHIGLLKVMETLKNEEGIIIAINHLSEAILLRENGFENAILYLNVFDSEDIPTIIKYNISVIIDSLTQLKLIDNLPISFHLKINTTMNRLGLNKKDAIKVVNQLNNEENDNFKGIMTHFANDDMDHQGYETFKKIASLVKKKDIIIHCFASSSLQEKFDDFTNYIRVGIKLYGIGERNSFLHNALHLSSSILTIKE
ncbi:MAG: alanine racemase, partial [Erysipelotrichaceae bacterium]|nr:alanine racemase [Erysipelotrichaceae bacterium]